MNKLLLIVLIIILSIPSVLPLFRDGFYSMHDDTQVERVIVMGRALRNGQFPVRWVDGLGYGYGYPIFNFYGPLPYYVGGFLYAAGVSGLVATKLMIGIGVALLGVTTFLFLRKVGGVLGAIVAAVVAIYMPYHAVQAYVRGAVGEVWTIAFLPLILWGIFEIVQNKKYSKGVFLGSIGLSATILAHTLLGFSTTFFLILGWCVTFFFLFLRRKKLETIRIVLLMIVTGLGMSAFFWLPALVEKGLTNVSGQVSITAQVSDHFVCIQQLLYSPWGFGGSIPGCIDGLSFALGKINIVIILLGTLMVLFKHKLQSIFFIGLFAFILVYGSLFFILNPSLFLWQSIPGFLYLQYPWRFLSYTILGVAIFAGLLITVLKSHVIKGLGSVILVIMVFVTSIKYFQPQFVNNISPEEYESANNIGFRASKISDEYLPRDFLIPKKPDEVATELFSKKDSMVSKIVESTETYKKIEFVSKYQQQVLFNLAHFPGWRYWVNGKEQTPMVEGGRPIVTIPNEFSTVQIRFTDTPVRSVGNVISLITVVLLGYFYGKKTIS